MKFFCDNNMPPKLVEAVGRLIDEPHEVKHLSEKFPRDTKDLIWIPKLASEGGWTIVSGDLRISLNRAERQAWLESGMVAFFLAKGWTNLPFWEQAWRLVKVWPKIITLADQMKPARGIRDSDFLAEVRAGQDLNQPSDGLPVRRT